VEELERAAAEHQKELTRLIALRHAEQVPLT